MRQTILAVLSLSAIAALLTGCGGDMVLLNSKGPVAEGQVNLMLTAIYLMLLVVIPSITYGSYGLVGNIARQIKTQTMHLHGHTRLQLKL